MLMLTSWLEKSRYRLPSSVQNQLPSPPVITIGFSVPCDDQLWKTCLRSLAYVAETGASTAVMAAIVFDTRWGVQSAHCYRTKSSRRPADIARGVRSTVGGHGSDDRVQEQRRHGAGLSGRRERAG